MPTHSNFITRYLDDGRGISISLHPMPCGSWNSTWYWSGRPYGTVQYGQGGGEHLRSEEDAIAAAVAEATERT